MTERPRPPHTLARCVYQPRIDPRAMLTHTFPLEQCREAFLAIANQGESGAVKVAFDQR